jgi:hypothetical protein
MSLRTGFSVAATVLFVLLPWSPYGRPAGGMLVGESFTLPAGETYQGDVVAVKSALTLEEGSAFEGNIVLIGGSLESAGRVIGDIASINAVIHVSASSTVDGDLSCIGPEPRVDAGATITGSIDTMKGFSLPFSSTADADSGSGAGGFQFGYELTVVLFRMFLLSAIAIVIVLLLPSPAERVTRTIVEKPAVSFLTGLLAMTAAVALLLLLAFTVCLSPISVLGSIVLLVAVLLGWSAMGREIGAQACAIFRAKAHPAVEAGIGTLVLTLVASALGYIPYAGPMLILLVASFGLGAVILTRFGGANCQILAAPTAPDAPPPVQD